MRVTAQNAQQRLSESHLLDNIVKISTMTTTSNNGCIVFHLLIGMNINTNSYSKSILIQTSLCIIIYGECVWMYFIPYTQSWLDRGRGGPVFCLACMSPGFSTVDEGSPFQYSWAPRRTTWANSLCTHSLESSCQTDPTITILALQNDFS